MPCRLTFHSSKFVVLMHVVSQLLRNCIYQGERSFVIRREKELNAKIESADVARNAIDNVETRIADLEVELQKSIAEKNDLEIKMEEALQDSG